MKVQALLCDAASARENLLFILGGGITRIWRPQIPAALNVDLGMLFTMHPLEARERHRLAVVVQSADGRRIAELAAEFGMNEQMIEQLELRAGESLSFPLAIPLRGVGVTEYGSYSIEILVDGGHVESLPFAVAPPPGAVADGGAEG